MATAGCGVKRTCFRKTTDALICAVAAVVIFQVSFLSTQHHEVLWPSGEASTINHEQQQSAQTSHLLKSLSSFQQAQDGNADAPQSEQAARAQDALHTNIHGDTMDSDKNPALASQPPKATIVVELTGEVGNNLQRIAFGYGLHLQLQRKFRLPTQLVLKMKGDNLPTQWASTERRIKTCFPHLRVFRFNQANGWDFEAIRQRQVDTVGAIERLVHGEKPSEMEQGLRQLSDLASRHSGPMQMTVDDRDETIMLPVIVVRKFAPRFFVDRFLDDYRRLFAFDSTSEQCCGILPEPDESVFHFRNFKTEIPNAAKFRGFEELSPNKTAHALFGQLQPGDKVIMTSRMHNDVTQAYVAALQQRGVKVRLVTDQTDMQDFCVLKSAQKELVGCAKSTFLLWAAYLGDMQRVRMYLVENSDAATQAFVKREAKRFSKYTNPKLKDRMQIQLYPNEEVEAMRQDASKH